jgi:5-methylcytosine-specific restriction endonuclease McrA
MSDRDTCMICLQIIEQFNLDEWGRVIGQAGTDVTLDHVLPKSLGGSSRKSNLALAHKKCNNRRKHDPHPNLALVLAHRDAD